MNYWLPSIKIKGYRPFRETTFQFTPLTVLVGANGSGKSSLFEFLKFLRDACYHEIPSEIIPGAIGQQIFHKPGSDKFGWNAEIALRQQASLAYNGELLGPVGAAKIVFEQVIAKQIVQPNDDNGFIFLDFYNGKGMVRDPEDHGLLRRGWDTKKPNQLGLGTITDSSLITLFTLREYIREWRFYNAFNINIEKIRKAVPTSQNPVLHEDAGNLSAVLFYLMTEYFEQFEELKSVLRSAIPGFKNLTVKARGGQGEVIAFWQENNIDVELSLADLSDGTLRFLAWATLCLLPSPPTLVCIDEPDQGVHPRTLPILSGLFDKASERTQIILSTHASYFLTQFDVSQIAVMKKANGESLFLRVENSQTLLDNLEDFGKDEIEKMHRSDELESLI